MSAMNVQTRQEAAEWLIELQLDVPDLATRERFVDWLRRSPEHVGAYLELVGVWEDAHHYDSARQVDVEELIARARRETNLVALDGVVTSRSVEAAQGGTGVGEVAVPRAAGARSRWNSLMGAVAAGLVLACAGVWVVLHNGHAYTTDVGEQRTVKLDDGSVAELNAVSRIRIRFSGAERRVDLLEGQALFQVAKDSQRPFVVVSGTTRVRAVGTEFDVNRKASGTVVTVLEGRVAVVSQPAVVATDRSVEAQATAVVELLAGEQVDVSHGRLAGKSLANTAAVTAWTQHQLIFESTPLAEVAEQFNRFNSRKLIVTGESIRHMQISGSFPALDSASLPRFVRFLREQPGVVLVESPGQVLVTAK